MRPNLFFKKYASPVQKILTEQYFSSVLGGVFLEEYVGLHGEEAYFLRNRLVWMAWGRISREKGWSGWPGSVFFKKKKSMKNISKFRFSQKLKKVAHIFFEHSVSGRTYGWISGAPRPSRPVYFSKNMRPRQGNQAISWEIRAPAKGTKLFLEKYASPTEKTLGKQRFFKRLQIQRRRPTPRSP